MSIDWPKTVAAIGGAVFGTGTLAAAVVAALAQRRKTKASAEKDFADARSVDSVTSKRLYDELLDLRGQNLTLWEQVSELQREVFDLGEENEQLKALLPQIALVAGVMDFDRVCTVFDAAGDGWTVTSVDDHGQAWFRWVNKAFGDALNMTRAEACAARWQDLVLPQDLEPTRRIEESAVGSPVFNFRNGYKRKGGGIVHLNWFCCPYKEQQTLAVVRMRVELPTPHGLPSA